MFDRVAMLALVLVCFVGGLSILVYVSHVIRAHKEWMAMKARRQAALKKREAQRLAARQAEEEATGVETVISPESPDAVEVAESESSGVPTKVG